jgi:Lipoprotein LpqB beta-propeller domain/Sporulation and spore germination
MASLGAARTVVRIPVRVRVMAGLAAGIVAVVVTGCAAVPSDGVPQQVNTGGGQVQAYVEQLPPPGPGAYRYPREVVLGFLHASASYAFDPTAARQFLLPPLRKSWHPVPGPVTVVSSIASTPTATERVRSPLDASSAGGQSVSVEFKGQRLATLSPTGQYRYSPGTRTYRFTLQQTSHGAWLISALPSGPAGLLLTQADFEHVFQARNLFFFALPPSPVDSNLVPDPVYALLQSSATSLASGLIRGLLSDQESWLSGATQTAFPPGTRLLGVSITGQTAVVNLGGAVVHASATQKLEVAEQLQATLGSAAYSPALARFVQLEINGRPANTGTFGSMIDDVPSGPLVYQSSQSSVSVGLGPHRQTLGPADFDSAAITAVAANPAADAQAEQVAVATTDGRGCELYLPKGGAGGPAVPYRSYRLSTSGGSCTSLSWDGNGNLWAVAGQRIWVLPAPYRRALAVALPPNLVASGQPAPKIIALRMAPDGVRAALLISPAAHGRGKRDDRLVLAAVQETGNQLSLGSAIPAGTGLQDPMAMSWFTPYDLLVLDQSGIAEVPLAGGAAQRLGSVPPGAESLATNGATIVVGTSNYQILTSSNMATTWSKPVAGAIPIYPG